MVFGSFSRFHLFAGAKSEIVLGPNGSLAQKIEGQRGQRDAVRRPHFVRSGVAAIRHREIDLGPQRSGDLILALSGQDQQLENAFVRIDYPPAPLHTARNLP